MGSFSGGLRAGDINVIRFTGTIGPERHLGVEQLNEWMDANPDVTIYSIDSFENRSEGKSVYTYVVTYEKP